jgi:uncharacterized protein YxjI
MRFQMQQKLFALGSDFVIRDGDDRDTYFVDGAALSIGARLSFQDMEHNELAFIRQRVLAWGPTYEILRDGDLAATVKKELFTFFRCTFTVDVPGPDDLVAEGDFTDHEYVFKRGERVVASVSKQWFAWTDSYGVDVDHDQDPVLILASTVVIDMACHPGGER